MLIREIDKGLERFVRTRLPLHEDIGDVSFEMPDRTWGAQLSRITVDLFLFDVANSPQPARPAQERVRPDGRVERLAPLPMVRLSYLATAWAGNVRDEHELLGELLGLMLTTQALPRELFEIELPGTAQLAPLARDGRRPGDIFGSIDGRMKPGIEIGVTVPLLPGDWMVGPPPVERIAGLVAPTPEQPAEQKPARRTSVRRNADGNLEAYAVGSAADHAANPADADADADAMPAGAVPVDG